jgi:hypothetical protein
MHSKKRCGAAAGPTQRRIRCTVAGRRAALEALAGGLAQLGDDRAAAIADPQLRDEAERLRAALA